MIPRCCNFCSVTAPMPQILRTGSAAMNSGTSFGVTSNCPLGLFRSLAILATSLFGPIPAEAVSFVFRKMRLRITCASAPGAPGCARDIEIRFIERERLDQRREAMEDCADHGRLPADKHRSASAAR